MHTCILYAVGPSCCVGHGAHLPNIRAFPICKYKRPTDKRRTTAFTISSPKAYKMKCRYPVLAAGVKWHSSWISVTERHRSKLLKLRSLYIRLYTALTHWTRGTYICIGSLTIIGLDYGLSRGRRQAIIWTNVEILFNRILVNKRQQNFDWNSYIFILGNACETVVCEMVATLSRRQCVNDTKF